MKAHTTFLKGPSVSYPHNEANNKDPFNDKVSNSLAIVYHFYCFA